MAEPDFSHIKAFVFDVDGVLTDGLLYCFQSGEQVRAFNIKDGLGIRMAIQQGYPVAVITAKNEPSVRQRLEDLGVKHLYFGIENKLKAFMSFISDVVLDPKTVLYMGDDLPDLEPMRDAGLAACPADAANDIKAIAGYVCENGGGKGAVREVIEKVLRAQDNWL